MKIAIPVSNGFVSSVFDFAHHLLVVDTEGQQETNRSQIQLEQQSAPQLAAKLAGLDVDVLICGVVSRPLASMLTASNIEVIPFVRRPVHQVLEAYFRSQLAESQFLQPGCWPDARKRFRHRHRSRCGHGRRHRGG